MDEQAWTALTTLFADVDPEIVRTIYEGADVKTYPHETVLIREGAVEETFYILLEGQADIYQYHQGEAHLIDYLTPGSSFGELALFLDVPRTADVVAAGPITVLEIDRDDMRRYIMPNTNALMAVVRLVLKRMLRQIDRNLLELAAGKRDQDDQPDVFISYSRQDEEFVRRLAIDLKKRKLHVWLDIFDIQPGQSWARQIGEALDACRMMVLVLSPDSMTSENVEDEWNYYLDKKKSIVPVLFRTCDIPYRLHKLQYIDFEETPYDNALTRLMADLQARLW